ncbi:MAG: SufS family cysteine desulfurase [Lachnospiraceae bacterium]
MSISVNEIRKDFPLLENQKVIYLDTAATSQKPVCVLEAEREFYEKYNANPLRGLYELGEAATEKYEEARETVREFLNAKEAAEIIFVRNATEGLNLVAYSFGSLVLKPGDEILVSIMEHHSNLLPWQQAAARTGAVVKYLECTEDGKYTEEAFKEALSDRTKIVAMTQVSNVLGCKNDIKRFAQLAHEAGAYFVADGAQSVPHMAVDVQDLDVDFLAFSGHKMYAPMGIGVLYAKRELLEQMPPFLCGGEMIDSVSRTGAVWAEVPHKFEAGTVNGGGAWALKAAIEYIRSLGFSALQGRELALTTQAMEELKRIPYVNIIGSRDPKEHNGIVNFTVEGVHPHDIASILDGAGVAVRAGHHCAQPLLKHLGVFVTTRASIAFYNDEEDIHRFTEAVKGIRRMMGYAE